MSAVAEQKLTPLARREGYGSVSEFICAVRGRQDQRLWGAVADALVQSDTRFFRDREVFKRLREDILPAIAAQRGTQARLRIWSAGCGPGQEAYSLAMLAEHWRDQGGLGCDIVATDFSDRMLEKARSGLYTQFEVQRGLPIRLLISNFEKAGDLWRIADRMRAAVRFEKHNLLSDPAKVADSAGGPFDLVLCRYVLSPMDGPTRGDIVGRIAQVAAPDAVLLLGENEPPPEGCDMFQGVGGVLTRTAARKAA
jgi:chemotaxis protein methyltransferase CheR